MPDKALPEQVVRVGDLCLVKPQSAIRHRVLITISPGFQQLAAADSVKQLDPHHAERDKAK